MISPLPFEILLLIAMALAVYRLSRGPGPADRMVAVDLLGLFFCSLLAAHAIRTGEEFVLDVVLVFAIIAYFGTVAVARYLQNRAKDQ
ncbi:MAG: monovalent cation/H+ antiporter complex subunit F [Verrucomicrobiales bacterium]